MNKQEVQQRVLLNGNPIPMEKFSWDESTNTFSSKEDKLVIDFEHINNCTFKTGGNSTVTTGWNSTVKTGDNSTVTTGDNSTVKTGGNSTVKTGDNSTVKTGWNSTVKTGKESVIMRSDIFCVIQPLEGEMVKTCPQHVEGYISQRVGEDAFYMNVNGERIAKQPLT